MNYSEFQNKLDLSAPINVNIEVTNKCNLKCIFCSADANGITGNDELSISDLLNLADELKELKVFKVKITGGEPFIKKDIMSFLAKLSRYHRISINTNGTSITGKIASELSQLNIDAVIVSLDSANRELNDRIRGRDSFDKIIAGINILKKFNIPISIAAVLTKLNVNKITELAHFVKGLGFSQLGVNYVYPRGRAENLYDKLSLDHSELAAFNSEVKEFNKESESIFISFEQSHWYEMEDVLKEGKSVTDNRRLLPCHAGVNQIGILSNGDVVPCLLFDSFKAGNIKKDKIADIWKSSPVIDKMKELAKTSVRQNELCKDCKFNPICNGGCRAKAYAHTGLFIGYRPLLPSS